MSFSSAHSRVIKKQAIRGGDASAIQRQKRFLGEVADAFENIFAAYFARRFEREHRLKHADATKHQARILIELVVAPIRGRPQRLMTGDAFRHPRARVFNRSSNRRANRAALPSMRKQGRGLDVWMSSISTRCGTPPYLLPYFSAKAAMDSLAVSYSTELSRWGIETLIVVPDAFTKGTNHFAHSGSPTDKARAAEYDDGPYAGLPEQALKGLSSLEPADADVGAGADAIRARRRSPHQYAALPRAHRSVAGWLRGRQRRGRPRPH